MNKSVLSEIRKLAANPALQHKLAERPMKEINALQVKVLNLRTMLDKASRTIRDAKYLREQKSAPKPFHVYRNGKVLAKETNYNLAWLKVFFDFFTVEKGSYWGISPGGSIEVGGRKYGYSLDNEDHERQLDDLFALPLIEIKNRLKGNNFAADHKKLYKLRLNLKLESKNYDVMDKRQKTAI